MADQLRSNDEYWMQYAIQLAEKAVGETHPNPLVGSVLVDTQNRVLAEGYHKKAGEPHAERNALTGVELSQTQQQTSTLYITLEPCCTHGRTPPCTDIILEKGIRRVVVGTIDPNPQHQSRGIELLKNEGIKVVTGVLEARCRALNPIFNHMMLGHHGPIIAVKTASTLDGKIATSFGNSRWITGEKARQHVMYWRRYFPAIAVGAGTALADNPSLTIRSGDITTACPIRFIFDRSMRTLSKVPELKVFNDDWREKTCLVTSEAIEECKLTPYLERGIQVLKLPYSDRTFPIREFRDACISREIAGVYVEGGLSVITSLLEVGGIDYLFCYQAPKLFASAEAPGFADGLSIEFPKQAPYIENPLHTSLGDDFLTQGPVKFPNRD